MKPKFPLFYLLAVVIIISGCSEMKEIKTTEKSKIPPGYSRVTTTIVQISDSLTSRNPKDPCSKAPCFTTIKIDSVIGYGSAFGGTLNVGDTISAKFLYTTAKTTDDLNLNISQKFHGVSSGTKIKVDIKRSISRKTKLPEYLIYGYEVLQ